MHIESVSALLFYSADPSRLAAFYRTHLGVPFVADHHGAIADHLEADLGAVHLAVLAGAGGVSPTFRVKDLDAAVATLRAAACPPLAEVLDLGDGKRVASFDDPDGNRFNLIEIVRSVR